MRRGRSLTANLMRLDGLHWGEEGAMAQKLLLKKLHPTPWVAHGETQHLFLAAGMEDAI